MWLHAGSVAEAMALPGLIARLTVERDDLNFLITTQNFGDEAQLEALFQPNTLHQYAPYEVPQAVDAFLDHWKPDLAIWSDGALHPVLILGVEAHRIPLVMIDGQMAEEASARWRWKPGTIKALLRCFARIVAIDSDSARNLRRLGAASDQVEVQGRLQESCVPLPYVQQERDHLAGVLEARPVWLAVAVSECEQALVIETHRAASRRSHRLLLILIPEACADGPALAQRLRSDGWTVALRSADEDPDPAVQILVADQPGELGLWYRLAPVSFLAQTFSGRAARDPLEAASLGSAILFGPNPTRFRARFNRLAEAGAARRVGARAKLSDELDHLLSPDRAAALSASAWEASTAGAEVTDRIVELVLDQLDQRGV